MFSLHHEACNSGKVKHFLIAASVCQGKGIHGSICGAQIPASSVSLPQNIFLSVAEFDKKHRSLMLMPVVNVGYMRTRVRDGRVSVRMRMRLLAIPVGVVFMPVLNVVHLAQCLYKQHQADAITVQSTKAGASAVPAAGNCRPVASAKLTAAMCTASPAEIRRVRLLSMAQRRQTPTTASAPSSHTGCLLRLPIEQHTASDDQRHFGNERSIW